jgi:pimeloyl-ACP methyl ester carboxylesterase
VTLFAAALMNSAGSKAACEALLPADYEHPNVIPARFVLQIPFMRPGAYASSIKVPILFAICGKDSVAPPGPTLAFAKKAPKGTIKYYKEMGHFDIYLGKPFEKATADYVDFLRLHLPVKTGAELAQEPVRSKL